VNRRGHRPAGRGEEGYSLIEVVVAAGMMSVLMAIFTTAVLQVFRTSGQAESAAAARSQLQLAFQRIDRELRYASWIADPGTSGAGSTLVYYVEFASSDNTECLQLRLRAANPVAPANDPDGQGVLQLIRWAPGSPAVKLRPDQTIASQLAVDAPPFERQLAGDLINDPGVPAFTPDFHRLRVRLSARVATSTADVDTTFTALNTSRSTPLTHVCSEGRPTP
jgi:type II secretory pathway pseudopilin PulG